MSAARPRVRIAARGAASRRTSPSTSLAAQTGRRVRAREADMDDLAGLAGLAEEDDSLVSEVEDHLADVEERVAELEEQRLFSGRYDSGDALVTINAGAGGTDAQDWAEMLLRMEMRW